MIPFILSIQNNSLFEEIKKNSKRKHHAKVVELANQLIHENALNTPVSVFKYKGNAAFEMQSVSLLNETGNQILSFPNISQDDFRYGYRLISRAHLFNGEIEEALSISQACNDTTFYSNLILLRGLVSKAEHLLYHKEYGEASYYYGILVQNCPYSTLFHERYAECLWEERMYDTIIKDTNSIIDQCSHQYTFCYKRVLLDICNGQFEEASKIINVSTENSQLKPFADLIYSLHALDPIVLKTFSQTKCPQETKFNETYRLLELKFMQNKSNYEKALLDSISEFPKSTKMILLLAEYYQSKNNTKFAEYLSKACEIDSPISKITTLSNDMIQNICNFKKPKLYRYQLDGYDKSEIVHL